MCDRVVIADPGETLADLILKIENGIEPRTSVLETCVPDGYALKGESLEAIDASRCTGCLACLEIGEAHYLDAQGVPTKAQIEDSLSIHSICQYCFQGTYVEFGPAPWKLAEHTLKDESRNTNPLMATYLWNLSCEPRSTYVCTSPSWEISLKTTDSQNQREGHLDVVVLNSRRKAMIVIEGKSSVTSLLRDIPREQWRRYHDSIMDISEEFGYTCIFAYGIGGTEFQLYPPDSDAPHYTRREEFYSYIGDGRKKFLSVEALRTLQAWRLSVDQRWSWEDWFPKLFGSTHFVGLLSGGVVLEGLAGYELIQAPWSFNSR